MRRTATLGLAPVAPPSSMLSAARTFLDSLPPMPSAPSSLTCLTLAVTTLLGAAIDAQEAVGQRRYILATGRRLPYMYVISLDAALDPANDRTSKAIVGRSKVATEALDGRLLGDPANLVVSEDSRTVYVVNHHGAIDNAAFRQHGGRGQIAVLDVDDLLAPRNDGTANALRRHMDSGGFGALGIVLLPEMLVIANAENHLTEDGGNRITFVDRRTGSLRGTVELALGSPGFPCPDYPVPYVPPYGPPRNLAVRAPDPGFGCFPNPNGLALGRATDGSAYVFSANGGTNDVSVIDLGRALRGDTPCGDRSHPDPGRPLGHHRHPRQAAHYRGERRESAGWIRGQHDLLHRRRPGERAARAAAPKWPASSSARTTRWSRAIR